MTHSKTNTQAPNVAYSILVLLACIAIVSANEVINIALEKTGLAVTKGQLIEPLTQNADIVKDGYTIKNNAPKRPSFTQRHSDTINALKFLGVHKYAVVLFKILGYALAVMLLLVIVVTPFAGVILFASLL